MYLWGATPFIAAALLTGATGAHTTAANHVAATPAVSLAGNGAASPVLHQVGTAWETTVLLNDINPGCGDVTAAKYWLATTTPYQVIGATPQSPAPIATTETTAGLGSSCQVTVTFKLSQRPQTATLVIDQAGGSSTVPLTVSRAVTLTDYLWIPAIAGGIVAILALLLSVVFVRGYDRRRGKTYDRQDWLERPILGSGAWTANDSWATNISTGLVVVAAVLGATSATNSLFPGVALDRFSIVNIAAGFFVVAAPVVFGILYARFTTKNPGLTADATIKLPTRQAATIRVPSGASITMAGDTTIRDSCARWAVVRGGGTYQIPPGSEIQLLTGIQDVAEQCAEAAAPAVANVLARAVAQLSVEAAALTLVDPDAPAVAQVVEQVVMRAGIYAPEGPLAATFAATFEDRLAAAATDAVQDHITWLTRVTGTLTTFGVRSQAISIPVPVDEADVLAAIRMGVEAAKDAIALGAGPPSAADLPTGILTLKLAVEQAVATAVTLPPEPSADTIRQDVIKAIEGEEFRVAAKKLAQETAAAPGRPVPPGISQDGSAAIIRAITAKLEEVLPRNAAAVTATDAMAYSGGADIGIMPSSTLRISASAGTWTIAASDVVTRPSSLPVPPTPPDAPLEQPVLIDAAGGAKLTVTGAADISLPKGAGILAPGRPCYPLNRDRQLLAPQGTNIIVANLKMVLTVNILTMFGIGAELGIGFVLAGLSDASGTGRGFIFAALAAVAVLVVFYAATAARTLADPQPGSSISAQAGASFTL
jgi:hypothetical protein